MTATNLNYPTYTFQVDLALKDQEIGALTNVKTVSSLHPDRYQESADQGNTDESQRKNHNSALLGVSKGPSTTSLEPALNIGNFLNLKDGDQFTLYGQQALDTRMKFVAGTWNNNVPTGGLGSILTIVE